MTNHRGELAMDEAGGPASAPLGDARPSASQLNATGEADATKTQASAAWASLATLCTLARYHQIAAGPANVAHQLGLAASSAISTQDLLRAAKHLGLKAKLSNTTPDRLALTPLPALAMMRAAVGGTRTVILAQIDGKRVLLQDPGEKMGSGLAKQHEAI